MTKFLTIVLAAASLSPLALPASAADLNVTIDTVSVSEGTVRLAIYDNKKDFRKTALVQLLKPATRGQLMFQITDLPAGEYAVMVYHDLNNNNKLDTRALFGIPKEPWGGSMNGNNYIGPPRWGNVNFQLPADGKSIVIQMN